MKTQPLEYFRNSILRLNPRPKEFHKASGFLRIKLQHPGLLYISREQGSRLLLYLDQGGKLALPGAGPKLIKFSPQIPLLRLNHLLSSNNSLVLKQFLVQSIGSITLLIRLIFYLDFLMKNLYSCVSFFGKQGQSLFLFYPLTGLGGLKRCFSNLFKPIKNFRKKNIFSNIFMGQKYSDSRWLYRLSMRILESDTLCPLTLTLIALGLLCQHIIYTRLFMDKRSLTNISEILF